MSSPATSDPLASARDAFERHAWQQAYDLLRESDATSPLGAEELEMLGLAAWWCGTIDECIAARERAYAAHIEAGEPARAAFMAMMLARDHSNKTAAVVAQSWARRAERLLADQQESPAHAYLELWRFRQAEANGAIGEALEHATRVADIGTRLGDPDVQALGLVHQGIAEVGRGNVEAGFALIDEATVAAVGGELSPFVTGVVYCTTIATCSEVGDFRRAGEWTEAARRWCERQSISGFPGICRVHRAEIMRLRGWWAEAERDAVQACTELKAHGIPALAMEGFNEIGTIRMRMGDFKEAEDGFRQAHELGSDAMPGLALLRLYQGQPDAASSLVRRALDERKDARQRARVLPAAVEIELARGDLDGAAAAAAELQTVAEEYGTDAFLAAAASARAEVELARGETDAAVQSARHAWRQWQQLEAPYEAAMSRLTAGRALREAGDEDSAQLELGAARASLEKLGARADLARLGDLFDRKEARPTGPRVGRTFVFTDIERSTNLVEAIGDEAWENLVGWHDRTLRDLFAAHGGEEVSHAGDGFFVAFESPQQAVECAVTIQRSLDEHRLSHGFAPQVRIGVHAAEATQRAGDYGGMGVHEAARIGAEARGGEIVASLETVESAGAEWETSDPREVSLKGIATPAKVVTVAWKQGLGPLRSP